MIREVTFPTPGKAAILSGNVMLGMHRMQLSSIAKAQVELTQRVMREAFARAPFKLELPPLIGFQVANRFAVTLTRIHPGQGLDLDNLITGFKHGGRDAVAQAIYGGIIGRDDGRSTITWEYRQRSAADGFVGMTIHIEDQERGDPVIVHLAPPARAGAAAQERPPPPPKRAARTAAKPEQAPIVFRRAWMALPWREDPAADRYEHLVEADALSKLLDVPAAIRVKDPNGLVYVLYRHDHIDPELGGSVHLYCDMRPKGTAP